MRWRSLFRLALVLLVILVAASWGMSRALQAGWGRRALLARLSSSFGRPVEVGHFEFNLFQGAELVADSVTVAEDPRFGNEYFLRADQIAASLSWTALLRGRIEFRTLSLSDPSLNLVRITDGSWNVENWLPPVSPGFGSPSTAAPERPASPRAGPRIAHIEVDQGRINFKRGAEKLQFAFTGVRGALDQDASGRWSVDIEAVPSRATVALQDVGAVRLRGTVAGTSARLRPAHLSLTWEEASLADALRMARGTDYGLRGSLGAEFSAAIENPAPGQDDNAAGRWNFQGTVRMIDVHRWDLVTRPSDPDLNLSLSASWQPGEPTLAITRYVVDAPHSQLSGLAQIDWAHGFAPSLEVASSRIDAADVLTWRRAFASGLPDDLTTNGNIELSGEVSGWPLRVEDANLASAGVSVSTGILGGPLRVGAIHAGMLRGIFTLAPVVLTLPDSLPEVARGAARGTAIAAAPATSAGALRFGAELGPFRHGAHPKEWTYRMSLSGETSRVQDLATLAKALGWPLRSDWTYEGAAALQLSWAGALDAGAPSPTGKLELHDLRLATAMLNQPLAISAASVELSPAGRTVKIEEAHAFGSRWTGSLQRYIGDSQWTFDLAADSLDVADLDRWLGPRARPGLFERMLPFRTEPSPPSPLDVTIARIKARGRLRVGELALASLRLAKVDGTADLDGTSVRLNSAQAELSGGRITGEFAATVSADPAYSFRGTLDRINLALLTNEMPELAGRFAGTASGQFALATHGIGRETLVGSLEGGGSLRVREAVVPIVNAAWAEPTDAGPPSAAGVSRFATGTASFRVAAGNVRLDSLRLADRDHEFEVTGTADFTHRLNLLVRPLPRAPDHAASDESTTAWSVTGTLQEPQVTRPPRIAASASGSAGSRR